MDQQARMFPVLVLWSLAQVGLGVVLTMGRGEELQYKPPSPPWWAPWRNSASRIRLVGAVTAFRQELTFLAEVTTTQSAGGNARTPGVAALHAAQELLHQVDRALRDNDIERGWHCFHVAHRLHFFALAELPNSSQGQASVALRARAHMALHEADEKLSAWRSKAVKALLLGDDGKLKPCVSLADVYYASQILQEHHDNVYHRNRIAGTQVLGLGLLTALIVVVLVALVWPGLTPEIGVAYPHVVLVVLFGLMGATTSGIFSLARSRAATRIPDLLGAGPVAVSRLAVGAAAALVVSTLVVSGPVQLLPAALNPPTPGIILVLSFAAGYSERLVVRALETIIRKDTKTDQT